MTLSLKNIKLSYLLSFISELNFREAILFLFFLQYLDYGRVALLMGIVALTVIVFEIPTGAFADRIGRKWSVFLSFLLYTLSLFAIIFTQDFWVFSVISVVMGISDALYSGSLEALMYDSLKEKKLESEFDKVVAHRESSALAGTFLAAIAGGIMYDISPTLPFLVMAIFYSIATFICLFLTEPKIDSIKYSVSGFFEQNLVGFRELFRNKLFSIRTVLLVIVIGIALVIFSESLEEFQLIEYGFSGTQIGIVFGIISLLGAAVSQYSVKVKHSAKAFFVIAATIGILLILSPRLPIFMGVIVLIINTQLLVIFKNMQSRFVNASITSESRATTLSTMSFLNQLPFAIAAFWIGSAMEAHSALTFGMYLGVALLLLSLVLGTRKRKMVSV
ncbi:MAG: MFS transporter [Candidatus Paceibacterota bacterium]|jgi:MFS family permease